MNSAGGGKNWGTLASQGAETANAAAVRLRFRRMPPPLMVNSLVGYIERRVVAEDKKVQSNKLVVRANQPEFPA